LLPSLADADGAAVLPGSRRAGNARPVVAAAR
jgi:hypothetical protein